jgi:hypothetical protein
VWGLSSTDVWAAGDNDALYRYTGSGWIPVPRFSMGTNYYGLWGYATTNLFLAGADGAILHYR